MLFGLFNVVAASFALFVVLLWGWALPFGCVDCCDVVRSFFGYFIGIGFGFEV